jgi:molecular chaperone DnaK
MARTTIDYGIDLGTTNSSIAVLRGSGPEPIRDDDSREIMPSVVAVDERGRTHVGWPAKSLVDERPDWGAREFKRKMGLDWSYPFANRRSTATPEELSAEVLSALREIAEQNESESLEAAVITIPASFRNPSCEATRRAAEIAGLKQTPLLQEPVAAALTYGFHSRGDKAFWLVYDFGGGTFDAAIIQVRDDIIHVVNHGGDDKLGGKDIDLAIVREILIPAIYREYGDFGIREADPRWQTVYGRLKAAAENAKIILSKKQQATVELEFSKNGGVAKELRFEYPLKRAEVERLAEPKIAQSIAITRRALAEKRLRPDHIEKILLVGGPTKMPYLRERLADSAEGLGIPIEFSVDPMTVVARGAAIFAGTQQIVRTTSKAPTKGVISLSLEFTPVGTDTEPPISGKASAPDVGDFRGYTVEFARPGWKSGKIELSREGTFYGTLFVETRGRTEFEIHIRDPKGSRCRTDLTTVAYTVGITISEQPLTATVGLELAGGKFDRLILKGTPLPAKKRRTYKNVVGVFPQAGTGCIRTRLLQGENDHARRNHKIGELTIRPDQVGRPVPAGSDVEILLEIDESQHFYLKAFIPILDEEFPVDWDYHQPSPSLQILKSEYAIELERLAKIAEQAKALGNSAALAALEAIDRQGVVRELETLLHAAADDQDALETARHRLLDLQIGLDAVEEDLNWPALVEQAKQEIQLTKKDIESAGNDGDKREAREIERELKAALQAKDGDVTRNRMEALSRVRFRVLARDPRFWVRWFQWCEERKSEVRDPAVGAKLLAQGHRAMQNNDLELLRSAVRQLLDQMPEREQKEIEQRFGSTLMRAENE